MRAALQRLVVRQLLSLPTPVLRLLAGGGVTYRAGRTLDPRFQFLASQARRAPSLATLDPEAARRAETMAFAQVAGDLPPGVRWDNESVPGAAGEIPARVYRPERQDMTLPLIVWAHMGGGVLGNLETTHAFCALLAARTRAPVISVDYRLAPEHRFPAGLEDVLAAYRWARDHAGQFGAKPGAAAIGGDSMGGAFAAAVCQELKRAGEPQPVMQLLVYPAVDLASDTPSMTQFADAFPLSKAVMDWFMAHYLAPDTDPADPRLSPLRARDLSGLAPAVIATAGFDPLVDQGEAYARALKAAGAAVTFRCYDSLAHAFTAFTGVIPAAEAACREIADLAAGALKGPPA